MTSTCDNIAITCSSSEVHSASCAAARNKAAADKYAETMKPALLELAASGKFGTSGIARELNTRGVKAPRGGNWHRTTVGRVLKRLGKDFEIERRAAYRKREVTYQRRVFGKLLGPSDLEKLTADYKKSK
tara:strand:- start:1735 stop:2124 length:390 start_codon:yes stop_codon:yes gene_type:complete